MSSSNNLKGENGLLWDNEFGSSLAFSSEEYAFFEYSGNEISGNKTTANFSEAGIYSGIVENPNFSLEKSTPAEKLRFVDCSTNGYSFPKVTPDASKRHSISILEPVDSSVISKYLDSKLLDESFSSEQKDTFNFLELPDARDAPQSYQVRQRMSVGGMYDRFPGNVQERYPGDVSDRLGQSHHKGFNGMSDKFMNSAHDSLSSPLNEKNLGPLSRRTLASYHCPSSPLMSVTNDENAANGRTFNNPLVFDGFTGLGFMLEDKESTEVKTVIPANMTESSRLLSSNAPVYNFERRISSPLLPKPGGPSYYSGNAYFERDVPAKIISTSVLKPGNGIHVEESENSQSPPVNSKKRGGPVRMCSNCGVNDTPMWRHSTGGNLLCNACGIYQMSHDGKSRPLTLASRRRQSSPKESNSLFMKPSTVSPSNLNQSDINGANKKRKL